MNNRLEKLPILSAENIQTENETNINLENIKKVLRNSPSQDEINSAKQYLDSIKLLKEEWGKNNSQMQESTKQKLWYLSWELTIYKETQVLLDQLRPTEKQSETVDEKIEFESLFKWIKNDMLELPKLAISWYIEWNEIFKKFDTQTKENFKIWLTAKIINSGFVDSFMQWFSSKIKWYTKAASWENIVESVWEIIDWDKKELWEIDFEAALKSQIENHWSIIKDFVKKNENHPKLSEFLKNTKNIEQINAESNLDNVKFATPKDEKEAFIQLQNKISEYNKQILTAENAKNQIFDQVSKMPSFISDAIVWFIKFLCWLSFIGDFIKKFLWLNGNSEDEIEKELKWEFEARKSINKLVSYWVKKWENWEIIKSKNEPAISILKDKDLSGLEVKKIKDSIVWMKNNWVDIMKSDFWFNVFEKNEIQFTRVNADKKNIIVTEKITANLVINDKDFDKNKCPNDEFYKKLNQILMINNIPPKTEPTKEVEKKEDQPKVENELAQYKDLLEWVIINNQIEDKLKVIKISDFENNSLDYINGKISQILWENKEVLPIITQYYNAIKGLKEQDKLKDFKITCLTDKKDKNNKEITFLDISYHRKNLIRELIWIIPESEEQNIVANEKKGKTTTDTWITTKVETTQDNWLPKSFAFDNKTKSLIIDWKKYWISAERTFIPISIDSVDYRKDSWEISISWSLWSKQNSKTLSQEEVKKYYVDIKQLKQGWEDMKINKWGIDIIITALS